MQTFVALLPYGLLAANTILLLALFFGINQRVRNQNARMKAREATLEMEAARNSNLIKELTNRIASLEKDDRQQNNGEASAGPLSSTIRGKVLKMHRLGQPAERISEVLRIPRGQVDLLVKVHTIVMRTYEGSSAQEPIEELPKKG
ncbi:MAG TPA: hypothetical protein VKT81_22785 [Bryobacteraceae bacterium]|nr:hypothetical protein [Bryobacteraceae bacterium]